MLWFKSIIFTYQLGQYMNFKSMPSARLLASLFLISFLCCFSHFAQAQEEEPAAFVVADDYNLWYVNTEKDAAIFANMAYVRKMPSTNSALVDSIPMGTPIKFLDNAGYNPMQLRGMYLPWYKIAYKINNQQKTGYIWIGLVSLDKKVDPSTGNTFLYGIAWHNDEESYDWVEAKVFNKNQQLIAKAGFANYRGEQSYCTSELTESENLKDSKLIYNVIFSGEACGIPTTTFGFAWDGTNLNALPKISSVSDAGVYYYSEELEFPKKYTKGNQLIIKKMEEGEVIDDTKEELEYKIKKSEERYSWDGKKYHLIP